MTPPHDTPDPSQLAEPTAGHGGHDTADSLSSAESRPTGSDIGPSSGEPTISPESPPGYEIVRVIGRGAMGVVYEARQTGLNRRVALKMILAGSHAGDSARRRFAREARAVAQIQHHNVVHIYDIGEYRNLPYFSMEYCPGGNLAQLLREKPMGPLDAALLIKTVAQAVEIANERKIIHRDLKPANILLTADHQPKVADFGLAKDLESEDGSTQSGSVLGTPSYMAPEQAAGRTRDIGPATDVYALGAILYHLLAGKPPFISPNPIETLMQVQQQEPPSVESLRPDTPPDLAAVCHKCLAKDPARRYATARELAEDLGRFLAGDPVLAASGVHRSSGIHRPLRRSWAETRLLIGFRNVIILGFYVGLIALLVIGIGQTSPGDAGPPAGADKRVAVRVELLSKEILEGRLQLNHVKVRSDMGNHEINPRRLKSIRFRAQDHPERPDAIEAEGLDHTLHGDVLEDTIPVVTDSGRRDISRKEIRHLTTIAARDNLVTGILIPLVALTAMEIVLGIDYIIFLAIIAGRLPKEQQSRARKLGLAAAPTTRLVLLGLLSFLLALTAPIFTLPPWPIFGGLGAREISWRDIILLAGGLFLIAKSTWEIHEKLKHEGGEHAPKRASRARFGMVLIQIALMAIIFSLESVIVAVGMVPSNLLWVMMTAVVASFIVMLIFAGAISSFVSRSPTRKILALSFLILIGAMLAAEGLDHHINKWYIYFAMAFWVAVEMLNLRMTKSQMLKLKASELPAGAQ